MEKMEISVFPTEETKRLYYANSQSLKISL
jgi:hypothetical protein